MEGVAFLLSISRGEANKLEHHVIGRDGGARLMRSSIPIQRARSRKIGLSLE